MSQGKDMSATAVIDTEEYSLDGGAFAKAKQAAEEKKAAARQAKEAEVRRKKKRAAILVTAAVIGVFVAVYVGGWSSSMGKFLANTYIDGVDVSGMTIARAAEQLRQANAPGELTVSGRGGQMTFSPESFGYEYDVFGAVKEIYENISHAGWLGAYFSDSFYETGISPEYDSEKLEKLLRRTVWGQTETADAKLVHGDEGYYIEPEVFGDKPDMDILTEYVSGEIAGGSFDIDLEKSGCYSDPKIHERDLKSKLEKLKNGFDYEIVYDFGFTSETLTGADIYDWFTDAGGLDRTKVTAYVESLGDKYDTFMKPRSFATTNRGTITMSQGRYSTGQYGWWIDRDKTAAALIDLINAGDTVTVEPEYVTLDTGYKYKGFPSGRSENGDIGNTYIEVDLSAQHMWYYKEGKLEFETGQIVSGKASDPKRKTPEGVYSVYNKSTNYTMVAADGSYTAKCSYFMRVSFEGIGFHDLSRSAYGGNIYLNNGSHGCINMKYDEVKKLYEMVEWGTPVVMYY